MKNLILSFLSLIVISSYAQLNHLNIKEQKEIPNLITKPGVSGLNKSKGELIIYPPSVYKSSTTYGVYPLSNSDLSKGFISGTNSFGDIGKAQAYTNNQTLKIKGCGIWIAEQFVGSGGTLVLNLYEMSSSGPGKVLATTSKLFADFSKKDFTNLYFPGTVTVTKDFAIGAEFTQMGNTMFGIVTCTLGQGGGLKLAWEKQKDGKWYNMSDKTNSWGVDFDLMLSAITEVTDVSSSFTVVPQSVCVGDAVTATYTGDAPAGAIYNWDYQDADLISGDGKGPYIFSWSTPGVKTITLIVQLDGQNSVLTTRNVYVHPGVELGPTVTISTHEIKILDAGPGFSSYEWSDGWYMQKDTIKGWDYGPGTFHFWVTTTDTAKGNCKKSDTITIIIKGNAGISSINPDKDFLKINPNPTNGIFNISFKEKFLLNSTIEISNINGQKIFSKKYFENIMTTSIDLTEYPKGFYFITFKNKDIIKSYKIVKY